MSKRARIVVDDAEAVAADVHPVVGALQWMCSLAAAGAELWLASNVDPQQPLELLRLWQNLLEHNPPGSTFFDAASTPPCAMSDVALASSVKSCFTTCQTLWRDILFAAADRRMAGNPDAAIDSCWNEQWIMDLICEVEDICVAILRGENTHTLADGSVPVEVWDVLRKFSCPGAMGRIRLPDIAAGIPCARRWFQGYVQVLKEGVQFSKWLHGASASRLDPGAVCGKQRSLAAKVLCLRTAASLGAVDPHPDEDVEDDLCKAVSDVDDLHTLYAETVDPYDGECDATRTQLLGVMEAVKDALSELAKVLSEAMRVAAEDPSTFGDRAADLAWSLVICVPLDVVVGAAFSGQSDK